MNGNHTTFDQPYDPLWIGTATKMLESNIITDRLAATMMIATGGKARNIKIEDNYIFDIEEYFYLPSVLDVYGFSVSFEGEIGGGDRHQRLVIMDSFIDRLNTLSIKHIHAMTEYKYCHSCKGKTQIFLFSKFRDRVSHAGVKAFYERLFCEFYNQPNVNTRDYDCDYPESMWLHIPQSWKPQSTKPTIR